MVDPSCIELPGACTGYDQMIPVRQIVLLPPEIFSDPAFQTITDNRIADAATDGDPQTGVCE